MKFLKVFSLVASLFISSSAWSLTITDVGGLDDFLASAYLGNSGDAAEEAWVESIVGFDVQLSDKYDTNGSDWTLIDHVSQTDIYATSLNTSSEYFMIKLGTGGTTLDSHFLFENIGDLAWAVVDFSDAGIDLTVRNINMNRLSHVAEMGEYHEVPEPSVIMLFGLGVIGLGLTLKRRG
jgi:hypothetical protein